MKSLERYQHESDDDKMEKLQLQKRRQQRKRPTRRWKKCNPVRKKNKEL